MLSFCRCSTIRINNARVNARRAAKMDFLFVLAAFFDGPWKILRPESFNGRRFHATQRNYFQGTWSSAKFAATRRERFRGLGHGVQKHRAWRPRRLDMNCRGVIFNLCNCCTCQLFMSCNARQCAREILETTPAVMRFIRGHVRRRRAEGLSLPQFRALTFLNRAKNASLSAAAGHLGLSLPAMSRLVNGLVEGGLVERWPVSTNRRQIALTLTVRGQATLEKVRAAIRRRLAETLAPLPASELEIIHRATEVLRKIFDSPPATEPKTRGVKP
jgi:DNA-binding MarR family transcriptional regulator